VFDFQETFHSFAPIFLYSQLLLHCVREAGSLPSCSHTVGLSGGRGGGGVLK